MHTTLFSKEDASYALQLQPTETHLMVRESMF
jgi:hypothetical protein